MTKGQIAYEKFNEAIGMTTVMPYDRLRPKIKEAWEKTAEYLAKLGANDESRKGTNAG